MMAERKDQFGSRPNKGMKMVGPSAGGKSP